MSKETNIETISINWVEYIKASDLKTTAQSLEWMEFVIVRSDRAWVFAWYLKQREWREVELVNSRRIWYWAWAASLSQLAIDWTSKPNECKFPCEVNTQIILDAIEIIPCSEKARLSINSVKIWTV